MSDIRDNYVSAEELNAASIEGEVNAAGILGDVQIGGVIIEEYPDIPIATTERLGGIIVGDHLTVTENGRLSVTVSEDVEDDNTHPITAAAVYTEIGNINALLHII